MLHEMHTTLIHLHYHAMSARRTSYDGVVFVFAFSSTAMMALLVADRALSLLAKANVLSRQLPYTGKTFLSRQLSYTRSLSLLGAVQRRTTQLVANGRIAQRVSLQRSMLSVRMPGHVLGTSGSLHLIGHYLSLSKSI